MSSQIRWLSLWKRPSLYGPGDVFIGRSGNLRLMLKPSNDPADPTRHDLMLSAADEAAPTRAPRTLRPAPPPATSDGAVGDEDALRRLFKGADR